MGDALGCVRRDPLSDSPAKRQAAKGKLRYLQRVREGENILAQHLNRIFAGSCVRRSMASCVVPQNLEVWKQVRYLLLPHCVVRTDRVRQDEDRSSRVSLQSVEHARIANSCEGQISAPCPCFPDRTAILELFEKARQTQDIPRAFPAA